MQTISRSQRSGLGPSTRALRPAVLATFVPIALTIAVPHTLLESVVVLRIALLVPLAMLATKATRSHWRFVFRGPIGAFAVAMLFAVLWSESPRQSFFSIGNWALETLAALAAVGLGGALASRYLATLIKALLIASAVLALVWPDAAQMDVPGTPWQGIFVHKNALGTVAAFGVVLFSTVGRPSHRARWVTFGLVVLLASQSRSALAAALIALLVEGAARFIHVRRATRKPPPASVFYGAVVAAGLALWSMSGAVLRLVGRNPDLTGRTAVWSAIVHYGRDHLAFGTGIGAQIYDGSALARQITAASGYTLGTTHNGYLVVYLGLGVVGLLMFALILAQVFLTAERARRRLGGGNDSVLMALGMLTCYLVLNVGEDRLLSRSGWFFLMFGVLQVVVRHRPHGVLTPASAPGFAAR